MMDIKLLGFNLMLVGVFVLIAKWPTKQYKKLLAEYLEAKKNGIDLSPMKSPWQDPYKHTGLINAWTKYITRRIAMLLVGLGVLLFFIGSP